MSYYAVNGLTNAAYRYRVRAYNSSGWGGYRYSPTFSVLLPAPQPASITTPTATDDNGSYTVSWAASNTATSYLMQESKDGGGYVTKYSGAALSKSFSGQTNATYRYRVRAANASW